MPKGFEYAGFWLRFAATLIDGLILLIPSSILAFLLPFSEIILNWLYYACLESSKSQATLGKRIVGIKIVDYNGKRITFGRASGRHFSKLISALILGVGFLMIAFTSEKQGLHDIIAKCYVIKHKK